VLPKHTRREGTRAAGFVAWFNSAAWQATAFGAVAHRATVESGFTTGEPGPAVAPTQATCSDCDLRWNCSAAATFGRTYPMVFPWSAPIRSI